jgi:NAD(P)-dependent dehydrogenase (short-subunit alcohol dehydrogenase family)
MKKTVLITGCSSGFGEDAVRTFTSAGWNVAATMRNPEKSPQFEQGVRVLKLDVQDRESIRSAVSSTIESFGGLDAVVNNAGFGLSGAFETTPREKILEQFDVNVFGLMDVVREVLPHFRQHRRGHIVNVTSGAGVFGLPLLSLYTASKFAVEGFSEAISHELLPFGIHVKLVEPGGVTSTRFGERSGSEAGASIKIDDYDIINSAAAKVFAGIRQSRSGGTSEEVAEVILRAAEDTSETLRYVATEGIKAWVTARRETSEAEYMAFMRKEVGLVGRN